MIKLILTAGGLSAVLGSTLCSMLTPESRNLWSIFKIIIIFFDIQSQSQNIGSKEYPYFLRRMCVSQCDHLTKGGEGGLKRCLAKSLNTHLFCWGLPWSTAYFQLVHYWFSVPLFTIDETLWRRAPQRRWGEQWWGAEGSRSWKLAKSCLSTSSLGLFQVSAKLFGDRKQ